MPLFEEIPVWIQSIRLDGDTYDAARDAAPGWDPYYIEAEWKSWMSKSDLAPPKKPELAFIAFCAKYSEKRGGP